jgi:hypothetical protein
MAEDLAYRLAASNPYHLFVAWKRGGKESRLVRRVNRLGEPGGYSLEHASLETWVQQRTTRMNELLEYEVDCKFDKLARYLFTVAPEQDLLHFCLYPRLMGAVKVEWDDRTEQLYKHVDGTFGGMSLMLDERAEYNQTRLRTDQLYWTLPDWAKGEVIRRLDAVDIPLMALCGGEQAQRHTDFKKLTLGMVTGVGKEVTK